ncbi:MAG TPA: TetR family transcriptional regulator [Gemmatimonadales bacterium]|jgi:AcrR family transcriptional regulator|nr:TetR family transcriptional regulator [Gemmatimonadales bacterium]
MTPRPKAVATKAKILEAALELFRERGYEAATMRAIADRAGVALGNAYYYFGSKEHLIQAFYDRTHIEHVAAVGTRLDKLKDLKSRLLWVMRKKLETIEPYHRFAGLLFRSAADPNSPLNPFSSESQPVRRESTAVFAKAVEGARGIPKDLRAELPNLLWLYHMGIVLFWIHDKSEGRWRTWHLMERSVDLITKLVAVASLSVLGPARRAALGIVRELQKHEAPGTAQ